VGPVRTVQKDGAVNLDHRQPATGGRDGVALLRMRFLPNPQPVQFGLKGGTVGDGRHARRVPRRLHVVPVVSGTCPRATEIRRFIRHSCFPFFLD
jgi:hypothetical protein